MYFKLIYIADEEEPCPTSSFNERSMFCLSLAAKMHVFYITFDFPSSIKNVHLHLGFTLLLSYIYLVGLAEVQ